MISKEERKRRVRQLKKNLKNTSYKLMRGRIAKCTLCGKEKELGYKHKHSCSCTRAEKIGASHKLSDKEFKHGIRDSIKVLGDYVNANTRIQVRCKNCNHEWTPFASNLKCHGCPTCAKSKLKKKNLKKYGVEYATQRPEVREKKRRTMLKRYGVEHALQNKELYDKNLETAYSYKEMKLDNKKVKLQGYEPEAIEWILSKGIKPQNIICGMNNKKIPSIKYHYKGMKRVYHPDIFLPKSNRIVEVKSDYTYRCSKKLNEIKRKACMEQGYKFTFLIMNRDGSRNVSVR